MTKACNSILPLEINMVERFYKGGSGLNRWRNINSCEDSFLSEDMLLSAIPYVGPGKVKDNGYSHVRFKNKSVRLSLLVSIDRYGFLGPKYASDENGSLGFGCRIGDSSSSRLVIQYHPTTEFAKQNLGIPFGKTEAWYIPATREASTYCLIGFKKGIIRNDFEKAFFKGDSEVIESMMNRVEIKQGDAILVPAGMIHAMGPNATFIEMHDPCDYTFKLERSIAGKTLSDADLHYGIGFNKLLDGLDYTTYTEDEILRNFKFSEHLISKDGGVELFSLIPYEANSAFRMDKIKISGEGTLRDFGSHILIIAARGEVRVSSESSIQEIKQGMGVFIPYSASSNLHFTGENSELIVGYPYEVK